MDEFTQANGSPFHEADKRLIGFKHHRNDVRPKFVHRKKDGRKPVDVENEGQYFLISDKAKKIFEAIDGSGFDFMGVDVEYEDGSVSEYWLCDVVRILDAVDIERSNLIILPGDPPIYSFLGSSQISFRRDVTLEAHVFRVKYAIQEIICDSILMDHCKNAGVKGLQFQKISENP